MVGWFWKHSEPRDATFDVGLILVCWSNPSPDIATVMLKYRSSPMVNLVWLTTCTELTDRPPFKADDATSVQHNNKTSVNVLLRPSVAMAGGRLSDGNKRIISVKLGGRKSREKSKKKSKRWRWNRHGGHSGWKHELVDRSKKRSTTTLCGTRDYLKKKTDKRKKFKIREKKNRKYAGSGRPYYRARCCVDNDDRSFSLSRTRVATLSFPLFDTTENFVTFLI